MNRKRERERERKTFHPSMGCRSRWLDGMQTGTVCQQFFFFFFFQCLVYIVYTYSRLVYTHTQRTVLSLHTRCAYTRSRTDCCLRYNKRRAARSIVCVCAHSVLQNDTNRYLRAFKVSMLSTFPWSIFQVSLLKQNYGRWLSIPCEAIGDDGGGNWRPLAGRLRLSIHTRLEMKNQIRSNR